MKRFMIAVVSVAALALAGGTPWAAASVVTFNRSDVVNAIGGLNDTTSQWGLWAVRARPVVTGGTYTITGASTTQSGWGTEAPSSYAWNTYGTNSAWFYDESGSEAWLASNPLYMIMDVPQDNFESYTFNGTGGFVGSYSPGGVGTFFPSGYNGVVGGTNLVTAVSNSSTFSFSFDLGSGATWDGTWQFLVDGSKYTLGTFLSPGVWQEDFFGDYTSGGGLPGNMGSGTAVVPEPASIAVWGLLGLVAGGCGLWRRKRAA